MLRTLGAQHDKGQAVILNRLNGLAGQGPDVLGWYFDRALLKVLGDLVFCAEAYNRIRNRIRPAAECE
jgi:hypothetical protein